MNVKKASIRSRGALWRGNAVLAAYIRLALTGFLFVRARLFVWQSAKEKPFIKGDLCDLFDF